MADALARRSHGFALDPAKLTVNQYLDHLRGSLRARTGARYTALLGDQVRPSSGGSSNRRDGARPARCRRPSGRRSAVAWPPATPAGRSPAGWAGRLRLCPGSWSATAAATTGRSALMRRPTGERPGPSRTS
jgi:hypothetical protein